MGVGDVSMFRFLVPIHIPAFNVLSMCVVGVKVTTMGAWILDTDLIATSCFVGVYFASRTLPNVPSPSRSNRR